MINFYFADLAKILLALMLSYFPSIGKMPTADSALLNVGNAINNMILTKGALGASPLWIFCSTTVTDHVTMADCQVPQVPELAIGHAFLPLDGVFKGTEWSDLQWQLSIDGKFINLADFGTYDYILPTMAPNPSFVREVFMKFKAWDIVLTNLQSGKHTIKGQVSSATEAYKWVVNLVIQNKASSNVSNKVGFKSCGFLGHRTSISPYC
jgi:hypothetical protein